MTPPEGICPAHSGIVTELGHISRSQEAQWDSIKSVAATCQAIQQSAALINQRLEAKIKEDERRIQEEEKGFVGIAKRLVIDIVKLALVAGVVWIATKMAGR